MEVSLEELRKASQHPQTLATLVNKAREKKGLSPVQVDQRVLDRAKKAIQCASVMGDTKAKIVTYRSHLRKIIVDVIYIFTRHCRVPVYLKVERTS